MSSNFKSWLLSRYQNLIAEAEIAALKSTKKTLRPLSPVFGCIDPNGNRWIAISSPRETPTGGAEGLRRRQALKEDSEEQDENGAERGE
jgi:hypothetical protein